MHRLVALDMPGGAAFVTALRRCFDAGDAVAPLDRRLPVPARARALAELRPSAVIGADGSEHRLPGGQPVEEGDAVVVATSGTTGEAKAAVLTYAAVRASALATSARLGVDPTSDTWLCCLPLAHVGGLSVVLRALELGTGLVVHPQFDAAEVIGAAGEGANLVSLVPTALRRLGEKAALFKRIVLGGMAPPEELPDNVVTTYGLTETGSGVVYDGWPLPGVEVRIREGEIQLRCPMALRGYRDGTTPLDANGWLSTGDGGELDRSGRLIVHGRLAEVVVTGGEKVWPATVEPVLARCPGVAEVAVTGVTDAEWGERLVACVVPTPNMALPRLEDLRALARAELGPWAAPKQLVLLRSLPRTSLGKLRRAALRAALNREHAGDPRPPEGPRPA